MSLRGHPAKKLSMDMASPKPGPKPETLFCAEAILA